MVRRIAAEIDVVLLDTGLSVDDHDDFSLRGVEGVRSLTEAYDPATNLELQTAIAAGAEGLVATYGGFAYLGPTVGVPTVSVWSEATFNRRHLELAREAVERLSDDDPAPGFLVVDAREAENLSLSSIGVRAGKEPRPAPKPQYRDDDDAPTDATDDAVTPATAPTAASHRARAVEERLASIAAGPGYQGYRRVLDWYLRLDELTERSAMSSAGVSEYWLEELETLDFMLDAGPLLIDRLRHHTYTITGIRAYDYRTKKSAARDRFVHKLATLVDLGGRDLLVSESPVLGGFGYAVDGALYNIDTLKYYEVLVAMDRGGALSAVRTQKQRSFVWEIGAGWGGFPYVFKSLFPNTTYAVVDLPELFLYSATYLSAAFPGCRITMWEGRSFTDEEWLTSDFVLIPNHALEHMTPPRLDLALNMVSFQEMTHDQVTAYVEHSHAIGAPFLASLNREKSNYNEEIESVTAILDSRFYAREIPVLPVNYTKMLDARHTKTAKKQKPGARERDPNDYRHIVGARRSMT
ncbi:MAG: putative sugar O-methyltransferase [Solirubrobacteraceae bacterium]